MLPHRPLRLAALAVAGVLLSGAVATVSAERLPVLRRVDAEAGPGAPFPPASDMRLLLVPGEEPALSFGTDRRLGLRSAAASTFVIEPGAVRRALTLDSQTGEVAEVRSHPSGLSLSRSRIRELVGVSVDGLAWDAAGDRLFALEAARSRILVVEGVHGAVVRRRVDEITLPDGLPPLGGLAFDAATGHLHALAPETGELIEIGPDGTLLANRLLPKQIRSPRAIAIAPSLDPTDAPLHASVFVAEETPGGGATLEIGLEPLQLAAAPLELATLAQTVNTAAFSPPSPDPAGVEVLPSGALLVSDSEVEEMSIYAGVNLWEVSLTGNVLWTGDTNFFSDEPTGVAFYPNNGKFYISQDDSPRGVFEVTPGADGRITSGDAVRQLPASGICSGGLCLDDAEGSAFGGGVLWIVDGVASEVFRVAPGPNGTFDGGGDDQISRFDTSTSGITDPEGVAFDTDSGGLYVAGGPNNRVAHYTSTGTLLRLLDTSAAGAREHSGLAYGPKPGDASRRRLYIVDRGIDNDSNPSENDGKLYFFELSPVGSGTNFPPNVSAGPDLTILLGQTASLDGTVSDDGLPNGTLTATWSKLFGPGNVSFSPNASSIDATASFSQGGSYVLQLLASDGELTASDTATVTVNDPNGPQLFERRVSASADDAEQAPSGSVSLTSSDLELVTDGTSVQTVGMRFTNVAIPRGALVSEAWIQFQTDETSSETTSLTIQGEASDNAAPFLSTSGNVSGRLRTSAATSWSPPSWSVVGEADESQRTPSLVSVVQQIVSRGGWVSGNAMAFLVTGSGRRVAEAFDGSATGAPLLHVVYQAASGGNTAPVVAISQPASDASFALGAPIAFSGSASDTPDGDLTAGLVWTSSRDGQIGTGGSFTRSNLSAGTHVITASVTDSGGLAGSAQVTIQVVNQSPQVTITSPGSGSIFLPGATIQFSGGASDPEQGDLTASLVWTSSRDGQIGTGGSFTRSNLSSGTHVITATVTDAGGSTGSAQVTVTVDPAGYPPMVQILSPASGSTWKRGTAVVFSATASDPETGDVSASLVWTSSKQGVIGTGASFTRSDLGMGPHTITATATDPGGKQATAQITIRIRK